MGNRTTLADDTARLDEIRNGMWKFQVERLHVKWAPWGSYRDTQGKLILENLGKNLVQFADGLTMMNEKDVIKQGADMLNLVLMLIDKGTPTGRVW